MFVRELTGRYAGEIREFPAHIARELIAAGRAENPYADPQPEPPVQEPEVPQKPARKRR
jgi:hypothetical protein